MAREKTNTTTTTALNAPDFLAWHVTQKGEKSFWNKVGAAWAHKDGTRLHAPAGDLPDQWAHRPARAAERCPANRKRGARLAPLLSSRAARYVLIHRIV